jgi:coniferyl-aldehyde dehydrogenase
MSNDKNSIENLNRVFALQKAAYWNNPNPDAGIRKDRLLRLAQMVLKNRDALLEALSNDFGLHPKQFGELAEVSSVAGRAALAMQSVDEWMVDDERPTDPAMVGSGKAFIRHQPKGVVGNISPWNFPIDLALGPLAEIFAAGNSSIIKPSEFTPECGELLAEMVSEFYSEEELFVVTGGPDVAKAFTALRWDHLLYTGSARIGREVMKAAAENLVPVTLELGGKCPVVMTEDAINPDGVASLLGGKLIKNGQMCVTVDYALVPQNSIDEFVSQAKAYFANGLDDYCDSQSCTGIITTRHYQRVLDLVEQAKNSGAEIVTLGGQPREETRQLPLTLVVNPSASLDIMNEEIFGPILPVIPYADVDEAISFINRNEKPLGLYVYSHTQEVIDKVIASTASGGVCVNGVGFQAALANMGFGGVGESGIGRHHGIEGFREFSNPRGILIRGENDLIDAMNPPYGEMSDAMVAGAREALAPLSK